MYLQHFGLNEYPFGITPDTAYAFSAVAHQQALNTLIVALEGGEGFVKITGEVGTGKTLLCRRLLKAMADRARTAYIPNPNLEPRTLLLALAEELEVSGELASLDEYHLIKALNGVLLENARMERNVIVFIDEAQAMPEPSLETLRLLSNLETERRKLIQIVLFGQPELDERLQRPSLRQLLQRIAFHFRLTGLGRGELPHYLAHRMRVAGMRGTEVFSRRAIKALYRASGGTPRLVNILAHKGLLSAFGEGRSVVLARHIAASARDTEGARRVGWVF